MILLCGLFLGLNLAYFHGKKCIYFPKDFLTIQMLSSLQRLLTKQKAEDAGARGRWKGLLQD